MSQLVPPYPAPDFSLVNQDSERLELADFRGQWLVLYFYPADDTPGCTTEACSIRDARDTIAETGAQIVGISMDTPAAHEKFRTKYNLNFTLLSDPRRVAIEAYGAWGKKMFGREGILRKTFIIDAKGMVRKVFGRVTPVGHGEEIIKALNDLRAA